MKADVSQIPATSSQTANAEPRQGDKESPYKAQSGAFAYVRRLERRIVELELTVSTIRRDLNRIDRANYRAKDSQPSLNKTPAPISAAPQAFDPNFWG